MAGRGERHNCVGGRWQACCFTRCFTQSAVHNLALLAKAASDACREKKTASRTSTAIQEKCRATCADSEGRSTFVLQWQCMSCGNFLLAVQWCVYPLTLLTYQWHCARACICARATCSRSAHHSSSSPGGAWAMSRALLRARHAACPSRQTPSHGRGRPHTCAAAKILPR